MVIQTPDQRLRVFISSTMKELAAERAAVRAAIERLRLAPVLFELGARPHPPRDLYLAYIRQSHVFLGIYWQQYGWVAPGQEISGLEDEYLAASDKPKLVYLKAPAVDREPPLTRMLERIRADGLSYRGFSTPEELEELVANDLGVLLSERFASTTAGPGASDGSKRRAHAPAATSRFVGRDSELVELQRLLSDPQTRLLTLVGPGGIGKTRLALQAVGNSAIDAPDGVVVVMLADVASPELVPSAILTALGVPESFGRSSREALIEYLRPRDVVLVLDNVEHLLGAAPFIAELLTAAEDLKVVATSREILHLAGERVFEVPPLAVPSDTEDVAVLGRSDAVELFVDRARAVRRGLQIDDDQLRIVAEICRRLDGLPLAIELAAARVRLFDPEQILRRLDRSLGLLTEGPRDLPERQRTLRRTVLWSYELLDAGDRVLFERLGVFSGGFSFEAVETVCTDEQLQDVLDRLASLVDKSLLRTAGTAGGTARFAMLETLREFALERLDAGDEAGRIRRAHAEFFLNLVLDSGSGSYRSYMDLIDRYEPDAANVGAAMRWLLDHGHHGRVARMGEALWRVWWVHSWVPKWVHGRFREGIGWMEEALAGAGPLEPLERAHASLALGMLAFGYGDYDRATPALRAATELYGRLGESRGMATASTPLGLITAATEHEDGEALLERAVAIFRQLDDRWGLSFALLSLGGALLFRDRFAAAAPLLTEAAEVARAAGIQIFVSNALVNLSRSHLGLGDLPAARRALHGSLEAAVTTDNRQSIARSLEALAAVALADGDPKRGALLFGAAEGIRRSIAATVWATDRESSQRTHDALRTQLGADEYRTVTDAGMNLPPGDLWQIAFADAEAEPNLDRSALSGRDRSEIDDAQGRPTGSRSAERFLLTVLFVDIVGSTARAVALGDRRWRNLLEAYLGMARRQLRRFDGTEIDTAGDGLFASFDRPADGVACACAIRDAAGAFGLEVRAGLHTGDTELIGGKAGGVTVHVAARVSALAEPSEVLVSRTVKDVLAGSDIRFRHRGTHPLKGLSEGWTLYRVEA